jgi:hypothetical protein
MRLVSYAAFICLLLVLYVWVFYPSIPQALGGGRPSVVQLVVEVAALPREVAGRSIEQPLSSSEARKATAELAVKLLYMTKDAYYVETLDGKRLSIRADAIKSTVW